MTIHEVLCKVATETAVSTFVVVPNVTRETRQRGAPVVTRLTTSSVRHPVSFLP